MLEHDEIEKKLKDHDQKFKQLYPATEELVQRVEKLERELADLKRRSAFPIHERGPAH
jgi:hypothetical protein